MKQEDKKLLLQDLCARIPYGVKIWYKYYPDKVTERFATSIRLVDEKIALSSKFNKEGDWYPIEEAKEILIKPYLRPMSSITEEEDKKFTSMCAHFYDSKVNGIVDVPYIQCYDWLNAHHFDYRGLIEKGLALEALEGMYK